MVSGDAVLTDNAWVSGQAEVAGKAVINGDAAVAGAAEILKESHVVTLTDQDSGVVWTAYRTRHDGRQILKGRTMVEESEAPKELLQATRKAWYSRG